jgi:hypothetical protein
MRSEPQAAVIFELDPCDPIACLQPALFHDGHVHYGRLKTVSGVAIQQDGAFVFTETNDAYVRNLARRCGS